MILKKRLVETYEVRAYCECGGELLPTGQCYTTYPPQYPHVCGICGMQTVLWEVYPTTKNEVVGPFKDMFT